jgi:hypothetical protein
MDNIIFHSRKLRSITPDASTILEFYFKDKNVIYARESLGHDGYDRDGPQSNLWDFDILVENSNNDYTLYSYHYEDWFCRINDGPDPKSGSLYLLYTTKELSGMDTKKQKFILEDILKYSKNEELKKYHEELV